MLKESFIQIYSGLADNIRKEIIVVIDDKPYSWTSAYFEIDKGTDLGKRILEKMKKMGFLK